MEQVLSVYERPYDERHPVICMDEQPKQLIDELRRPLPMKSGQPARCDYEYVRNGSCCVWMFVEPLAGWRQVSVSARRTAVDWAEHVKAIMTSERYSNAETITLVCDQLNTHAISSLYKAFDADEAFELTKRLRIVHTPRHGSWLNMAEPELSVLSRQALNRRIAAQPEVATIAEAWNQHRNQKQTGIDWQFKTTDARIKLKSLYPKIIA
jgi:hypothetical protein